MMIFCKRFGCPFQTFAFICLLSGDCQGLSRSESFRVNILFDLSCFTNKLPTCKLEIKVFSLRPAGSMSGADMSSSLRRRLHFVIVRMVFPLHLISSAFDVLFPLSASKRLWNKDLLWCCVFLFDLLQPTWHLSVANMFVWHQGRNKGRGKGGAIPRAPNHYWGAEKSQQCHKYFLQQHVCFWKTSGSSMGAPKLLLAPGAI